MSLSKCHHRQAHTPSSSGHPGRGMPSNCSCKKGARKARAEKATYRGISRNFPEAPIKLQPMPAYENTTSDHSKPQKQNIRGVKIRAQGTRPEDAANQGIRLFLSSTDKSSECPEHLRCPYQSVIKGRHTTTERGIPSNCACKKGAREAGAEKATYQGISRRIPGVPIKVQPNAGLRKHVERA